jgi:hypothetical protein
MALLTKHALSALGLLGCLALGAEDRPALPVPIKPPPGSVLLFRLDADGDQVYECKAVKGEKGPKWVLKGPLADLYDEADLLVGTHYAGPYWQAKDGSKVRGVVKRVRPAPRAGNVPWLLLKAEGHAGKGMFANVTWIQRVNTRGGQPPAGPCEKGKEVRVPYSATYVFYGKKE